VTVNAPPWGPGYLDRQRVACQWITRAGHPCSRRSIPTLRHCWMHAYLAEPPPWRTTEWIPLTLAQCAQRIKKNLARPESAIVHVAQFEEDYRFSDLQQRIVATEEEPLLTGSPYWDAYLAALADYLAYHDGYASPAWVFADSRYLAHPRFAAKNLTPGGKRLALSTSPAPFLVRGVLIWDTDLEKV